MTVRVGQGFDVHAFSDDPARKLVLGGVVFDGERGLVGHSDADVVAHACADALLGAAGLGDIGQHFPDTDPKWAGADSIGLLSEVARLVRESGFEPGNVVWAVDESKAAPKKVKADLVYLVHNMIEAGMSREEVARIFDVPKEVIDNLRQSRTLLENATFF